MNKIQLILGTSALVLLSFGCAHPIRVAPNIQNLEPASGTYRRHGATVAYHISFEAMNREITTGAGGGDSVRYFPFRDMEAGYHKVLSNVFNRVVRLQSTADRSAIQRDGIDYVFVPEIVTTSGGAGFATWPPTSFTVDLTNYIRDANGKLVASPRVVGVGAGETGMRLTGHGIAGSRAMEDALIKLQAALLEIPLQTPKFRSQPQESAAHTSLADRLEKLMELKAGGVITDAEYEAKRKEILEAL